MTICRQSVIRILVFRILGACGVLGWGSATLGFGAAAPSPEIRVFAGASITSPELVDGRVAPLKYGNTPIGMPLTRSYTVRNSGTGDLHLTDLILPEGYERVGGPFTPITLPYKTNHTLQIRLMANSHKGLFSGKMSFISNDANEASFDINLTGYVHIAGLPDVLDTNFNQTGKVITKMQNNAQGNGVALQADGKIIVVGSCILPNSQVIVIALARYTPQGKLDPSFGTLGRVFTSITAYKDYANAVAVQSDGKIVVAGSAQGGSEDDSDFAVARYASDGALDVTFGSAGTGIVITDFSKNRNDVAYSMAVQSDGKIVVAGTSSNGANLDFAVARYTTAGILDTGFSTDGKVTAAIGAGDDTAYAMALQANGNIVVAGSASGFFAVVRYTKLGSLDYTFGELGKVITPAIGTYEDIARGVVIQPDGKIVLAGYATDTTGLPGGIVFPGSGPTKFALARYTSVGQLDETFGTAGFVTTAFNADSRANGVALKHDGKIVAAGSSGPGFSGNQFAVAQYTTSGTLDTTFNGTGKITTRMTAGNVNADLMNDVARAVVVQPGGKIVVAGSNSGFVGLFQTPPDMGFAIARYGTDVNPTVATEAATEVTKTTAKLNASVDTKGVLTQVVFEWGATSSYGLTTGAQSAGDAKSVVTVSADPAGLAPDRLYHYRVVARSDESVVYGADMTFFTGPDLYVFPDTDETQPELNLDGSVDFGPIILDGGTEVRTFTLRNRGSMALALVDAPDAVTVTGSADFTVSLQPAASIAPGDATTFAITFDPSSEGVKSALVSIANSDEDKTPYTFAIQGEGVIPAGPVSFHSAVYQAHQGHYEVGLYLQRASGSPPGSVTIQTHDGTPSQSPPFVAAVAGTNYVPRETKFKYGLGAPSFVYVELELIPKAGVAPNRRFTVTLSNPTGGVLLGAITTATVEILANDTGKPTLTITTPTAGKYSAAAPYFVRGIAGDSRGIGHVEVTLFGGATQTAFLGPSTSPGSVPYFIPINLVPGSNTILVTAYDMRGNSTTVTRNFNLVTRHVLTLSRQVPGEFASKPDTVGSIAMAADPGADASSLIPTAANSNPRFAEVVPGALVKLTATAKKGFIFSHWLGIPTDVLVVGNVATFIMPNSDVSGATAVFIASPFKPAGGASNTFYGLLHPTGVTASSNATEGFFTGALAESGAFTGKVFIDGVAQAINGTFFGTGPAIFRTGSITQPAFPFGGRSLVLSFAGDAITAVLFKGEDTSDGIATRGIYSTANKLTGPLLNSAAKGFYTLRFDPTAIPRGYGFATVTVSNVGIVTMAGVLADGTALTSSSALVAGNASSVFAQLPTPGAAAAIKGGSFGGVLLFDPATDSDVTAGNLLWFRPPAVGSSAPVNLYSLGWPNGIFVNALGALYSAKTPVQTTLALGDPDPGGNADLTFNDGKLTGAITLSNFNITGNAVTKLPANDASFTLSLASTKGSFKGTFTPNWSNPASVKPAFKGILIQKGANRGGYGFFISNVKDDLDPEGGSVTLSGQR